MRLGQALIEAGHATTEELDAVRKHILTSFDDAVERAKAQPQPTLADLTTHVLA